MPPRNSANRSKTSTIADSKPRAVNPPKPSSTMEGAKPLDGKPVISRDILAIGELIGNMKGTLHELHNHFNLLGKEMEQVAELAPAVKATEEINKLREKYKKQVGDHEQELEALKSQLHNRVEEAIRARFYQEAQSVMQGAVQQKVSYKVGRLLAEKIPEELRAQGKGHKHRILEIQTNLHNAEARRRNSSIESPTDSLVPLRPLPPTSLAHSPETPTTAVEPPVWQSQKFPENLAKLWLLSLPELKSLLLNHGVDLPKPKDGGQSKLDSPTTPKSAETLVNDEDELSQEELINLFMTHIGAPLRVLPAPNSASQSPVAGKKATRPLVTKINTRPCFA